VFRQFVRYLALLIIFGLGVCRPVTAFGADSLTVCVIPMSNPLIEDLQLVRQTIELFFGFEVVVKERTKPPATAYVEAWGRYQNENLLTHYNQSLSDECGMQIILTELSVCQVTDKSQCWGVFATAQLGGPSFVLSTFRLAGLASFERNRFLARTVIHEVGHLFGLNHSADGSCLMASYQSSHDRTSINMCAETRKKLEHKLQKPLPETKILEPLFKQ
jgi:predicted Zn-dependent protease